MHNGQDRCCTPIKEIVSFIGATIIVFFCTNVFAQTISTYAGIGSSGDIGDGGLATSAKIEPPGECVFDALGNCYFAERLGNRIRKVSASGIISTFAGTGVAGFSGDSGLANAAQLNSPTGITIDSSGNLFIADFYNNRIREVNAVTGIITTIAGNGSAGFSGDGDSAIAASFSSVTYLCFDSFDNLYAIDGNRVRKINSSGIISTIAGNANHGYSSDGGMADTTELYYPQGVTCDASGNVYIADWQNERVRKVDVNTGIISTFAGNGIGYYNGEGVAAITAGINPWALVFDKIGNLCIADYANNRVRIVDTMGTIYTIAGNGIAGFSGDGDLADSAELSGPEGVAYDSCDNLCISDTENDRIRKVAFNPYCWPEKVNNIELQNISIYPNPAYDVLNIDNVNTQTTYSLLNIVGIIEQSGTLKTGHNTITIQALPPGIYLLEVMNSDREKTVRKIIKQ